MNNLFDNNGYINVTKICKKAGKDIREWKKTKSSRLYLTELSKELKISEIKLLYSIKGGNTALQGTFAHPFLGIYISQWCSAKFAVKVSSWIEEWKNIKMENRNIYNDSLVNIIPDENQNQKEKEIQLELYKKLGGKMEVETEFGYIDLLTIGELIEIKHEKNWKHAVGQLVVYSLEYPNHQKRLHLFGIEVNERINRACLSQNIIVTYSIL